MNEAINGSMLMAVLFLAAGAVALWFSPDALEVTARKLKARTAGLRAARRAYLEAETNSLRGDRLQEQIEEIGIGQD